MDIANLVRHRAKTLLHQFSEVMPLREGLVEIKRYQIGSTDVALVIVFLVMACKFWQ